MQKIFRMLLFNFHGLLTQTVYNPNCQTKLIILCKLNAIHEAKKLPKISNIWEKSSETSFIMSHILLSFT